MSAQYQRWFCSPSELAGLTPQRARDLVIECFFQAQHETLERGHVTMGLDLDPDSIRMEAEGAVRNAFMRTGGDYKNPSRSSLERAVGSLLETASNFGTPVDIIEHHEQQISMVLAGLPG
jgi:hypothetical protein